MSINAIIMKMEQLLQLHESLLKISKAKTEALKKGDISELQSLLLKEKKHSQAISKLEKDRMEKVSDWYQQNNFSIGQPSVTDMIGNLENIEDKQKLKDVSEQFIYTLSELKQQEKLNNDLTRQSLQFIEFSMNMLQPSLKNMNYGTPTGANNSEKRSVFDSKA
ncbi:flagellar protein FlgN [Thalassobacillus pellis]|uniref:flagellar protein FlgN n=1 Tax=Thalassobacillus pellis TaxID=748008 RepID=UPI001961040A|nr:flagellar protein FlgN [Thalassobacillus pellis]MBM7551435.1 flagellar biosynthesis/type III secretory pathway chaperone [Thalassobacillus pellis]